MFRYQNNSFRVLGLLPNVSMREIIQRANEIKVKNSLNMPINYAYDFPWLGPVDRTEQNVINALQRLEDPILRLREEIFWFWFDTVRDKEAIEHLINGSRQASHEIWAGSINPDVLDEHSLSAFVNQTILAHGSVIGKELNLKYEGDKHLDMMKLYCKNCYKSFDEEYKYCLACGTELIKEKQSIHAKNKNIELNDTHWKNWNFAINRFLKLASSEVFWRNIGEKAKTKKDPRLTGKRVEELRDNFLQDVTGANFTFMSNALFGKDRERIKKHSYILNGSSIPATTLKAGFNGLLSSRLQLLNRICEASAKQVNQISEDDSLENIMEIYYAFKKEITGVMDECNEIDFNCVSDLVLARDSVAETIRSIAIKINNSFNDYDKACTVLADAVKYASSSYLKQSFEKDKRILKSNLEEEKSFQYQNKIGGTNLEITKQHIAFGATTLKHEDIKGIKYGIFIQYTNGIPTSRSYRIWLTDNTRTIDIECGRGFSANKMQEDFKAIIERLYKVVQVPMVLKMIADFTAGKPVTVGNKTDYITIDHKGWHRKFEYGAVSKGLISLSSKLIGTENAESKEAKKKFLSWEDYHGYNHNQGMIVIARKQKKDGSAEEWFSLNLRDTWNAVNLGVFLELLHKDGKLWSILPK